jgi:hypothetical protein
MCAYAFPVKHLVIPNAYTLRHQQTRAPSTTAPAACTAAFPQRSSELTCRLSSVWRDQGRRHTRQPRAEEGSVFHRDVRSFDVAVVDDVEEVG